MSIEKTNIEWADFTWNPWIGCSKVSPGCKHCYMFREQARWGKDGGVIRRAGKQAFYKPLALAKKLKESALGQTVFTCSFSDFFHASADQWRNEAWDIIADTPQLRYLVLTKRPERITVTLPNIDVDFSHVWFGTTVEQTETAWRIETLAKAYIQHRFISFEPLLAPIDVSRYADALAHIDWAIIGGESGNNTGLYRYRDCRVEWMLDLIAQLRLYNPGISIFVKQLGTSLAKEYKLRSRTGADMEEWLANLTLAGLAIREKPAGLCEPYITF